jgi:hypothetical protein
VIPILRVAGLHVTSFQNPLTWLPDSAAAACHVLAQQDGPTVLAGQSGTLVSEVGTDPKVSALVYVAACAPDAGEDFVALSGKSHHVRARRGRGA